MTIAAAKKLNNGAYVVFWKSGGKSIAVVGRLHDGKPWLAPANWTSKDAVVFRADQWRKVHSVVLIMDNKRLDSLKK